MDNWAANGMFDEQNASAITSESNQNASAITSESLLNYFREQYSFDYWNAFPVWNRSAINLTRYAQSDFRERNLYLTSFNSQQTLHLLDPFAYRRRYLCLYPQRAKKITLTCIYLILCDTYFSGGLYHASVNRIFVASSRFVGKQKRP